MTHDEVIRHLRMKAENNAYLVGNDGIDVKKVLDDYYSLIID